MRSLDIRLADDCRYDLVSLGEVMLRLDPGENRIRTARRFQAWEGGGEYNVARGLRRCFNMRTAIVTALVDNEIGRLIEDLILQGGVDTAQLIWMPFDGVGHRVRNGLNFTERGFGIRGALGVSDRAHSATSHLKPGAIDWDRLFGEQGVRWFHTGGIFAALSESAAALAHEAIAAARRHDVVVSYDLNYRRSLWAERGGLDAAQRVNQALVQGVDVVIGNEEDFTACLGLEVPNTDERLDILDVANFKYMIDQASHRYPNVRVIATTLRTVTSASTNDWGAIAWADGEFAEAPTRRGLQILDRIGGGDSFASGLIYALLTRHDIQRAVDYGAAHGALAMTTPGDTSMATQKEVEHLVAGGSARVRR